MKELKYICSVRGAHHPPAVITVTEHPDYFLLNITGELVFEDANDLMHAVINHYVGECVMAPKAIIQIFPNGIEISGSRGKEMTKRLMREYLKSHSQH